MDLVPGVLLVAEPALLDPNFRRTAILLCDHNDGGSFGLVVNRPTELHLSEVLVEPVGIDSRLYLGGPVQPDTLHVLHGYAAAVPDAIPLFADVGWGGRFDDVAEGLREGSFEEERVRFFAGYAGWGGGQLEAEIEEGSWIVLEAVPELVFAAPGALWRGIMRGLGGEYALLSNYPDDPRSN